MYNEGYIRQLVNYIKKNIAKGYTAEALRWALISQGNARIEVDKAIKQANEELALQAPKFVEKPMIKVQIEPEPEKRSLWQEIISWFS